LKFAIIIGGVVGGIVIALGAKARVDTSTAPKPYDVAMYDVYSDLLQYQEEPWLYRALYPQPGGVLIRVETEPGYDADEEFANVFERTVPSDPTSKRFSALDETSIPVEADKRLKQAIQSAIVDYSKQNTSILELQRKFSLPHYDLFTKAEERSLLKNDPSACQKYAGYEGWVELSAVGFNQDQTVAVMHIIKWQLRPCSNRIVGATGKYRILQKQGGKWHLSAIQLGAVWNLDS